MTLSGKTDVALKILSPIVITEPYYDFFSSLVDLGEELNEEPVIKKEKIIKNYVHLLTEIDSKFLENKKKLSQLIEDLIIKLHNTMWINTDDEIIDIDWESVRDLYDLLKFIKKSDERKVSWAIYYLFFKNGQSITIQKIKELLTVFNIKNIEKHIKKIVDDSKKDGMKISFVGSSVVIDYNKSKDEDKKIVKHNLADQLEFYTRRQRMSLKDDILKLLDQGSFSNQEISNMLEVDKSQTSKMIKLLLDDEEIVHSSFGQHGKQFFTTNCKKCPFGTNYDACREESISFIVNTIKKEFNFTLDSEYLNKEIEYNQSLLYIKQILVDAKKDKFTKMELTTLGGLIYIYQTALQQYLKSENKKSKEKYQSLATFLNIMPIQMVAGHNIGHQTGSSLIGKFLLDTIGPYIPKSKQKEINEKLLYEYGKFKKITTVNVKNLK